MLSKGKAEWDGNDWKEYTQRIVHAIGGDAENMYLIRYLQRELENLYSEAYADGSDQAWHDAYEAYN